MADIVERTYEVNADLKGRLEKVAAMPISAFVCTYILDGEIRTDAGAINAEELEKISNG